jgi:MFS family permease
MSHDGFAALRLPTLRRYIVGRTAASLGMHMLVTAVGWDIWARTHSLMALATVGLMQVLPVLLFALPAGQLIDRHNRKTAALLANLVHLAAAIMIAVGSLTQAPLTLLYAALLVNGVARSASSPAGNALFAQLTPVEVLLNANAWRSTSFEVAAVLGPALAGLVIWLSGGATLVYALNAAGALLFTLVLVGLPRPPTPGASRGPLVTELMAGLRFVFRTPLMLSALTLDLFAVLFGGATALLPVFADEILHVGPAEFGLLRAAPAIGAVVMAVVTTHLLPWQRSGRVLLWTVAGFGASIVVFGLSRWFWLSFVALLATGVFDNISVVIRLSLEQLIVPEALRGRVGAVHNVFIGLSNEMGEFESGLAAALLGPAPAVIVGGVITLAVVGLTAWRWPQLRRLGRLADVRPASG